MGAAAVGVGEREWAEDAEEEDALAAPYPAAKPAAAAGASDMEGRRDNDDAVRPVVEVGRWLLLGGRAAAEEAEAAEADGWEGAWIAGEVYTEKDL